jgi:predicted O-linked N-acetylglucosamine transferase (SPINDLY family)
LAEHVRWNERFARPLAPQEGFIHPNEPNPNRRLRIGYVSPDLMDHPVGRFMVAPLRHRDRDAFEVYCYADVARPDVITRRLQASADVWRETSALSDEQLAKIIRADRIDVLVDLVMHSGAGRPLLFARRSAPVQVAWLAYPGTTGLSAMDYRLTDPYLDPLGTDGNYTERSVRLPDIFWCYDPLNDEPPVNALPAAQAGHATFGCLNNFSKCNARVLEVWSAVLRSAPGSRLLLLAPDGAARRRVLSIMQKAGDVDAGRIEFVPHQSRDAYLRTYHRIDVALDTFPYSGHTTTFDACWMGVPTVSLAGQTPVSRGGLSILSNLGLSDWVGTTREQFIDIAIRRARELPHLAQLRATMRERMRSSPLMDGERMARGLEASYRDMWRRWCNTVIRG